MSENNLARRIIYKLVINKWFDYFMFFIIVLNCVTMAYEHPHLDPKALDGQLLYWRCVVGGSEMFSVSETCTRGSSCVTVHCLCASL